MDTLENQLMEAIRSAKLEVVQMLIEKGCRVDVGDADNLTPLHLAAMRDHQDIAELLIKNGANVNRKTTDKMAPLHYAAVRGFVEMVDVLVRGGATVDPLDANDRTPLMLAVNRDHLDVVEALIRYGARLNIEEIHGYTPLCEAVFNKSVPVASLLLKSGAKLTQSQHLLHYAMLHRHLAMAELLLKHGAYPNLRDDHGDTPLILAISCSHLDMVKLLLQYEANPNYANSISGETPLHHAVCVGWHDLFDEILELLCLHNVDLNASSGGSSATTPLTTALIKWELNCAVSLIRAGADVNLCFAKNDWPLMHTNLTLALTRQADSLVYLIVAAGCDMSRYSVDYPQDFSEVDPDTLRGWLIYVKFNPPRLTDLCRLNLRSQMGNKALRLIPSLEIPRSLKEFLFYKDIYVKKYCALTDNKNTLMNYVFSLPLGQQE